MKKSAFVGCAFVLLAARATAHASVESPEIPAKTVASANDAAWNWGATDISGLQLGIALNGRYSSTIAGLVRNNGKTVAKVNLIGITRPQMLSSLQARQVGSSQWTTVELKPDILKMYSGIGPQVYRVCELRPQEKLTFAKMYASSISAENAAAKQLVFLEPSQIDWTKFRSIDGYEFGMIDLPHEDEALVSNTFSKRLIDYAFPDEWNKTIEIRVSQFFMSGEKRPSFQGTLQSGSVFVAPERVHSQTLPSPKSVLRDVKLERGGEHLGDRSRAATLSVERFITLMKTATPMSDVEFAKQSIPGGYWHRGTFRVDDAPYRFVLGLGGVNYLATPNGTIIRFKTQNE